MARSRVRSSVAALGLSVVALGCAARGPASPAAPAGQPTAAAVAPQAMVAAADRTPGDRAIDAARAPAETLAFIGARPGWRVAELAAGGGYLTELLARAVAPDGVVYGQNSTLILETFARKPWNARLKRPAMKNVISVERQMEAPLPPDARNLDAAVSSLYDHDGYWPRVDRARLHRAVFDALKPGGLYVVVHHGSPAETGARGGSTRARPQAVRDEILRAGFVFDREGDFLRGPPAGRGRPERFILAFRRP